MNKISLIVFLGIALMACNTIEDKTKKAINKSGEVIGKGATEFANGISEGVDKTLECNIVISESLKNKGLKTGKFSIETDSSGTNRNRLVIYFIFEKDMNQTLQFKVFDSKKLEAGRSSLQVAGKSGEAKYADVVFDSRTNIESRNTITIE